MSILPTPSDIPLPTSPRCLPLDESHRVEELWFKDGTLVLGVERSIFRVYGGLLAEKSPVFHDMLEFPQPDDAEVFDGCPVVHLPDNEHDMKCFLRALFDFEFFLPFPEETTLDTLIGVIRISTKYQVDSLRKRALKHLSSSFPPTLAEYPASPSWHIPGAEWIHVVNFAREMSLDWILPFALYHVVAHCRPALLLNGTDVDGVHLELKPADKLLCLEQAVTMTGDASSQITDWLWEPLPIPGCSSGYNCTKARIAARKNAEGWRAQLTPPLRLWEPEDWDTLKVCQQCESAMKTRCQAAREAFWQGLPGRFGISGWDALKQMKEEQLA
ncbi:hypothetical protein DFH09DRAFT_1309863 [Mycena vulgaris]|nr:hypothetical protein DFH09DRAFT_1309863 [Mycena vulgaris]